MSAEALVHGLNEANTDRTGLTRSEPVKCNYLSLIHGSAGSYFFFFLFYFFFFFVSAFLLSELNAMEQLPGGVPVGFVHKSAIPKSFCSAEMTSNFSPVLFAFFPMKKLFRGLSVI